MRVLVLGGTAFVGRAIVQALLAGGHEVVLFGRGRTGADLFPGVQRSLGDRAPGDYGALAGTRWDCVVDVSAYVPRHVRQVLDALGVPGAGLEASGGARWPDRFERYLLISTGSVYDRLRAVPGLDEGSPRLAPLRDTEEVDEDTYGPLKVACEDEALARCGARATIVRPGVVAGPHDPTDRFTWWVRRAAAGGRLALPADPDQPVQVVDSRDLAALVVALLTAGRAGVYNAVGPEPATTLAGLVRACAHAAGSEVEVVPVPPAALHPPLPLVAPDPSWVVMSQRSAARARAAGMPATALTRTAADVLAWDRERGAPPLRVGPDAEAEARSLAGR